MYFLTSAARQLATAPPLPDLPQEPIICLRPSPKKSLFCTLTRNGVTVWRVRVRKRQTYFVKFGLRLPLQPPAALAYLSRSPVSIIDHGENVEVHWSFDSTRLVIQVWQYHFS
jgi:hypothetical protein